MSLFKAKVHRLKVNAGGHTPQYPIDATPDGAHTVLARGWVPVLVSGREKTYLPPLSRPISAIAISPDGSTIAADGGSMLRLMHR
ncbi:MAG: hypothetical protein ACI8RZ_001601 [Myxococcota bacterium]